MAANILIIDDEPNITSSFSSLLSDEGYRTITGQSAEEAKKILKNKTFDLLLLDLNLPGQSGIELLKEIKTASLYPEVLIISGQSEITTALEALKLGAIDYLEKPVSPEKLIASVKSTMMLIDANRQRNLIVEEIDAKSLFVGQSKSLNKLIQTIDQVAPTDATVLITGANGTGKELAATRIFLQSKRRNKPFIKVNCPGIPETLFESELFGHRKGSFTGAVKDHPGKFNQADRGTLFLDEIGDLPLDCQAKLLRVLESGEVETIGETNPKNVDVRLICATNRNLPLLISESKFREDLFYRISVFQIDVPPLKDRVEDIPFLAGEFLKRYDPAGDMKLSAEAMAYLTSYDYPGNVRQLKNIIERLTILFQGKTVGLNDITAQLNSKKFDNFHDADSLNQKVAQFEKQLILNTLDECEGNITKTAAVLKVDRANLSRKIKDFNLKTNEQK